MSDCDYGPRAFAAQFDVSRETMARLVSLHDILVKWSPRINLIARGELLGVWRRHFADSAQLVGMAGVRSVHWVDVGAGAGFPGLVVAAMLRDHSERPKVTLIESDQRKAAFLVEAVRAMQVDVAVLPTRVETLMSLSADVLSARAVAPLDVLLGYLKKHRSPTGIGLFPKGEAVHKEIAAAAQKWRFDYRLHPSVTAPEASIVEVGTVARA